MDIQLGADPELFFTKDGLPEMAIGYVGGTKRNPKPLGIGHIQEDNVAAEYNIPPQASKAGWVEAHKSMLDSIRTIAAANKLQLAITPVMHFTRAQLQSTPEAMQLGCVPDDSIYGEDYQRPSPFQTLRTCGGHVHIGCELAINSPQRVVEAMDIYLGLPASIVDKDWAERAAMYGGFGKYRNKDYGLEYRSLSNFWLQSENLMEWVWDGTIKALTLAASTRAFSLEVAKQHMDAFAIVIPEVA